MLMQINTLKETEVDICRYVLAELSPIAFARKVIGHVRPSVFILTFELFFYLNFCIYIWAYIVGGVAQW